jgi:ABC-type bacteriocin/lantibiotic exporter with double-glycine peptidase domain
MGFNFFPAVILIASILWIDVPFVRQTEQGCGAASIAMVMQYWSTKGHSIDSNAMDAVRIMDRLYTKASRGIRANEVQQYFVENGFQAIVFSAKLNDFAHHIQKGRPLIAALETKGKPGQFHYLVVVGVDPEQDMILVNDPSERKLMKMRVSDFEERQLATDHWTLLAVPKE